MNFNKVAEKAATKAGLSSRKVKEVSPIIAKVFEEESKKVKKIKSKKKIVIESKDITEPSNSYAK